MKKKNKQKIEFSKGLLIQESILIWITTLAFLALAVFCIIKGYMGDFGWITAMAACPWASYTVSQTFYYTKAKAENKIKLKRSLKLDNEDLKEIFSEKDGDVF